MKRFITLAALLCLAVTSHAAPILDKDRIALGLGASHEWYGGETVPQDAAEFAGNLFAAYALTEHFSAACRVVYGFGNEAFRTTPALHYNMKAGGESFALSGGHDFYAHGGQNEWVLAGIYAKRVGPVVVALSEGYGFDTKGFRTSVQLTLPLFVGREKD